MEEHEVGEEELGEEADADGRADLQERWVPGSEKQMRKGRRRKLGEAADRKRWGLGSDERRGGEESASVASGGQVCRDVSCWCVHLMSWSSLVMMMVLLLPMAYHDDGVAYER